MNEFQRTCHDCGLIMSLIEIQMSIPNGDGGYRNTCFSCFPKRKNSFPPFLSRQPPKELTDDIKMLISEFEERFEASK